jgi:hypothetical protein
MNEVRRRASEWVQCATVSLANMINEPGHPTGHLVIPAKETIMLKTISAALLAVSMLAAPAFAASTGTSAQTQTAQTPVIKAEQVKQAKPLKPGVANANAKMGRHGRHFRHHRFHKRFGAIKTHRLSKVTTRHAMSVTKRG